MMWNNIHKKAAGLSWETMSLGHKTINLVVYQRNTDRVEKTLNLKWSPPAWRKFRGHFATNMTEWMVYQLHAISELKWLGTLCRLYRFSTLRWLFNRLCLTSFKTFTNCLLSTSSGISSWIFHLCKRGDPARKGKIISNGAARVASCLAVLKPNWNQVPFWSHVTCVSPWCKIKASLRLRLNRSAWEGWGL
jgi:hypothetical protein